MISNFMKERLEALAAEILPQAKICIRYFSRSPFVRNNLDLSSGNVTKPENRRLAVNFRWRIFPAK
jgi:hypothetical protein